MRLAGPFLCLMILKTLILTSSHQIPQSEWVVRRADPRLERSGRQDFLINILRSELHAAFFLMEHRERWWTAGLHNAESFVGMEMDRVRASEHNAAQEMNSQMTSLVETLRAA